MRFGALLGLGLVGALAATMGCAANNNTTSSSSGSAGTGALGGGGAGGNAGGTAGNGPGGQGGQGGFEACNKFSAEAEQAPAAMLFVLDRSASMGGSQKWSSAQLAVVSAIDKDVFDSMSLGVVTFPQTFNDPPQCLCDALCGGPGACSIAECKGYLQQFYNQPGVACGISGLPQVPVSAAGPKSFEGPGTRKAIYDFLADSKNGPIEDASDASPIYEALVAGYGALQANPVDRKILILITDGGFSCTSLSNPHRDGYTDGACLDWEYPDTVNTLITTKRTDPQKPVFTFIVGVPGSNSKGEMQGSYATAPYSMQLALSTYAVSGSPNTVDPACNKDLAFDKNGQPPALPCHFDLSSGGAFNADSLASAIQSIKGKALGCVYDLPAPPAGEELDKDYVNVDVTLDDILAPLKKRADPNDTCAADGCWDYNVGSQVQILGKTCDDISKAAKAKVDIKVGCQTIVK